MDVGAVMLYDQVVMRGELRVVLQQGRNVVGTWENLVLAVWGESPTEGPMTAIHQTHLDLLKTYDRVGHLVIIHGSPKIPAPEARDLAGRYNERSQMSSVAVVVDGEGFWASAARGFLTWVLFLRRSKAPTQLFRNLDEALAWQAEVLGASAPDEVGAMRAIEALRARSVAGA